jgi:hypothetical protein
VWQRFVRCKHPLALHPAAFSTATAIRLPKTARIVGSSAPWARTISTGSRSSGSSRPSDSGEYRRGPQWPDSHSPDSAFVRCPLCSSSGRIVYGSGTFGVPADEHHYFDRKRAEFLDSRESLAKAVSAFSSLGAADSNATGTDVSHRLPRSSNARTSVPVATRNTVRLVTIEVAGHSE